MWLALCCTKINHHQSRAGSKLGSPCIWHRCRRPGNPYDQQMQSERCQNQITQIRQELIAHWSAFYILCSLVYFRCFLQQLPREFMGGAWSGCPNSVPDMEQQPSVGSAEAVAGRGGDDAPLDAAEEWEFDSLTDTSSSGDSDSTGSSGAGPNSRAGGIGQATPVTACACKRVLLQK